MFQQQLGGAELPAPLRDKLQDQTLENLIQNALLAQRTEKLGYRASSADLREAIQGVPGFQIARPVFPGGSEGRSGAGRDLARELRESELRTDVRRVQLEGGIRASNFLTPSELKRLTSLEDQQREVRYFVLPADKFAAGIKVDDAAVAAYYKAHQSQYMTARV